jgi:hypothetical protein
MHSALVDFRYIYVQCIIYYYRLFFIVVPTQITLFLSTLPMSLPHQVQCNPHDGYLITTDNLRTE